MQTNSIALALVILFTFAALIVAQDGTPDQQPRIITAAPLAVKANTPSKIILRGKRLDEVTEIRSDTASVKADIVSKGKAPVPQNYEAQRVGDTQLELKITFDAGTIQQFRLTAVAATGVSPSYLVKVLGQDELIEDKEPNDGFKSAQPISIGKTIVGTIHEPRNVDVFELKGQAGQKLTIEIIASQAGSLLDPFLTVYDASGQVLKGSDDSKGRDALVEVVPRTAGSVFICVQDANDAGGTHFGYLLNVK